MKTKKLAIASLLAAALGTITVTQAASYQLSDTNGDGVISAEEIRAARQAHRAEQVALYDTDADGELSRDERRSMKDARRAEMLSQFDADGDGELSREERRAAKDARRATMEASLDVNGDGELSDAEMAGFEEIKEDRKSGKRGKKNCDHKRGHGEQSA